MVIPAPFAAEMADPVHAVALGHSMYHTDVSELVIPVVVVATGSEATTDPVKSVAPLDELPVTDIEPRVIVTAPTFLTINDICAVVVPVTNVALSMFMLD